MASNLVTSPLGQMFFKNWNLAFHETIKQRHRESGFPMSLAPDHAFGNQLLARGCHRIGLNPQGGGYIPGLVRPRPKLCHGPKITLLQNGEPIKPHSKKISIQMSDNSRLGGHHIRLGYGAFGSGVPHK